MSDVAIDLKYTSLILGLVCTLVYFYWRLSARLTQWAEWKSSIEHRIEHLENLSSVDKRLDRICDRQSVFSDKAKNFENRIKNLERANE